MLSGNDSEWAAFVAAKPKVFPSAKDISRRLRVPSKVLREVFPHVIVERLTVDMLDWCRDRCDDRWVWTRVTVDSSAVIFVDEQEAMMFCLASGGSIVVP
jgi:hypothetical protein